MKTTDDKQLYFPLCKKAKAELCLTSSSTTYGRIAAGILPSTSGGGRAGGLQLGAAEGSYFLNVSRHVLTSYSFLCASGRNLQPRAHWVKGGGRLGYLKIKGKNFKFRCVFFIGFLYYSLWCSHCFGAEVQIQFNFFSITIIL